MARKGRTDRGLMQREDVQGKLTWYVRLYHENKERRFGSFPTKTKAREFYEKAKVQQAEGKFFPERHQRGLMTTKECIAKHLTTLTVKYPKAETAYGKWWVEYCGGKKIHAITPKDLESAQQKLHARQFAPQTVLHYMKFFRHVLNKAVRDGRIERNPFARITLPKIGKGKTRYLTPQEEARLLKALGTPYSHWARLAILTGIRLGEQFSLKWNEVCLDQGVLTLARTKAQEVQYVPLNTEAREILRAIQIKQMNTRTCGTWVFPSAKQKTHMDQRNFYSRVFLPAVKVAQLEGVTWHTLRHTFASRLAMSGHNEGTIAALMRHSTTALVKRYAHLSPTHLRSAVETVATFGQDDQILNPNRDINRKREGVEKGGQCVSG